MHPSSFRYAATASCMYKCSSDGFVQHCHSCYLRQLSRGPLTVQGLSHLPGWGEKNFQVLGKAFEIVKQLAQLETGLGKKDAFVAITGLVAKLSDGKLKGSACEALSALSEAVGPQFVCAQLHKQASSQKNPKVRLSMPLSSVHLSHWAPLHLCRSVHVATPPVFDVILNSVLLHTGAQ